MGEIAVRVHKGAHSVPHRKLQTLLPEAIVGRAPLLLESGTHTHDSAGNLVLFLKTNNADEAVPWVLAALAQITILGNRFTQGVDVAVAEETHCRDLAKFRIVSPTKGGTLANAK